MATAVSALAGFLFKGPFSGALAFLQPVIYSGGRSLPRANRTNPICNSTPTSLITLIFQSQNSDVVSVLALRSGGHTTTSPTLPPLSAFDRMRALIAFDLSGHSLFWPLRPAKRRLDLCRFISASFPQQQMFLPIVH